MSERLMPGQVVTELNQFYKLASKIVFDLDGTLDKMIGDQVMAFFGPPFKPDDHQKSAVQAALEIVSGVERMAGETESLHVGAGVGTGQAFMGNVGEGEVRDFTAIGDTVNTAARLQGEAASGEVLVMEETYAGVASEFPNAPERTLQLKGKSEPVTVRVLRLGGHD